MSALSAGGFEAGVGSFDDHAAFHLGEAAMMRKRNSPPAVLVSNPSVRERNAMPRSPRLWTVSMTWRTDRPRRSSL